MKRYVVETLLWRGLATGNPTLAGDDIYLAYDGDSAPRFSSQPYDDHYMLYLRGPIPLPTVEARTSHLSLHERSAAMAWPILQAAQRHGMDPAQLSAFAEFESRFNVNAVSPKRAIGVMQIIPKTAADYGVTNPYDLLQNLDGGARHRKNLLAVHHGNLPFALAAYNAGNANIERHYQPIPHFNETMLLYVPRALTRMADYQRGNGL